MDEAAWSQLLASLTVQGVLLPISSEQLGAYERRTGFRLPGSYRSFCRVFGPGTLAEWFEIAAPFYCGSFSEQFGLDAKNDWYRNGTEWDEYVEDQDQFRRAVLFAGDHTGAAYFWDQARPSVPEANEYAIYSVARDYAVAYVCATFWEFVRICLHQGDKTLDGDLPPPRTFRPVWRGEQAD